MGGWVREVAHNSGQLKYGLNMDDTSEVGLFNFKACRQGNKPTSREVLDIQLREASPVVSPVQTKNGLPSLVSCPLRTVGFSAKGWCCVPQQAAQVETHSLFLTSEAAPMHSPRSLHHLVTGYQEDSKGLERGALPARHPR